MSDIFSEDIPRLLKEHLEHLQNSAISLEVIQERGYKSALGKKPLKEAGFSNAQQRAPGILIPLHGVEGKVIGHQYRPDNPREDAKRKRPVKYENPTGSSVRVDVPPRCQANLGNPAVPLWITEGVKKADALASASACAIGLTGVWGFKGKNLLGGTTILADFDYIALKERLVYIIFDSDSTSNPQVAMALRRLAEHLKRKGAGVRILDIPSADPDKKVGADDYLAQGHSLDDMAKLEVTEEAIEATLRERSGEVYCVDSGRICWVKQTQTGPVTMPLCNFTARVIEDILRDDGHETSRVFKMIGTLGSGQGLPIIDVTSSGFNSLNWVTSEWGMKAIIAAGQTYKDRLREAIQLQSQSAEQRTIYTHTGWREVNGEMTFLTASGALGIPEVDVELEGPLQRYSLPEHNDDPSDAIRASLDFLEIGEPEVLSPLWSAIYLAPLSDILSPALTLWLVGPSGTFKSTLAALALCHFGQFTIRTLPASWRDTANYLEKQLALGKDIPLVIDDWAPAQDMGKAREYETKAEQVARAQGNRLGRGRLRSDTSSRASYVPRGMLISTGEQLPSGQSHSARLFSVEIEPGSIDKKKLTAAQKISSIYPVAMTHYILWLKELWPVLKENLNSDWEKWRDQAREQAWEKDTHPRLPEAVAWLYAGLNLAVTFAEETGVISSEKADEHRKQGWGIFLKLAAAQGGRVEEERPGKRFLEALIALIDQGRVVLWRKDEEEPKRAVPGETMVGWKDDDYLLLNQSAAYAAVHEFCQRAGEPFTFKQSAVWKDLKRLGHIVCQNGRHTDVIWVYNQAKRVIRLKISSLHAIQ